MKANMSRKEFIERCIIYFGLLGLLPFLQGCAGFDPKKSYSDVPSDKFDIERFRKWYFKNRLYNDRNRNLKNPHSTFQLFRVCFYRAYNPPTPGIGYTVPSGEVMVASAPGIVKYTQGLAHTGRAGGLMTIIEHNPCTTYYAHLNKVYVEDGQIVKRGDPIGNVTDHKKYAKLLLNRWEDPDNYGVNHNYMNYYSDVEIENDKPRMKADFSKIAKQAKIAYQIEKKCNFF
jgi:hypothetical protein